MLVLVKDWKQVKPFPQFTSLQVLTSQYQLELLNTAILALPQIYKILILIEETNVTPPVHLRQSEIFGPRIITSIP